MHSMTPTMKINTYLGMTHNHKQNTSQYENYIQGIAYICSSTNIVFFLKKYYVHYNDICNVL